MNYPKIGIRPVIDGRLGGVRESLEATTIQMAKNVAALLQRNYIILMEKPVAFLISLVYFAFYGSRLYAKVHYSNSAPGKKFHNIH